MTASAPFVCYRVELSCTNCLHSTTHNEKTNVYRPVESGVAYVVTDNPGQIYAVFGDANVLKIERMGLGYMFVSGEPVAPERF